MRRGEGRPGLDNTHDRRCAGEVWGEVWTFAGRLFAGIAPPHHSKHARTQASKHARTHVCSSAHDPVSDVEAAVVEVIDRPWVKEARERARHARHARTEPS